MERKSESAKSALDRSNGTALRAAAGILFALYTFALLHNVADRRRPIK
jgi:hypothetical protein